MTRNQVADLLWSNALLQQPLCLQEAAIKTWIRSAYDYGYTLGQIETINRIAAKTSNIKPESE
jgi:hypothetical protein